MPPCRLLLCAVIILSAASGCGLVTSSQHRTEDYTPVFAAASACDLGTVQKAVQATPDLLKATEWSHATLLHDAVGQNCVDEVKYLLDAGSNVNAVTSDGLTPLHMAAQNGNTGIITLLLAKGANRNAVDAKGWTPVDRAQKWEHPQAAALLEQGMQNTTAQ